MYYNLRPGLSYCILDGRPIFLDIDADRYFRLGRALEDAFLEYVGADGGHGPWLHALLDGAILVPGSARNRATQIAPPARSSIEMKADCGRVGIAAVLQVFMIVWSTQRQLRHQPLKQVLRGVARYREERLSDAARSVHDEAKILEAARNFTCARLYVPFETCCLLDSLSMTKYLAARRMSTNIVFGVADPPFSAHCWVQAGDLVLNDTVGNAMAHMPIREI